MYNLKQPIKHQMELIDSTELTQMVIEYQQSGKGKCLLFHHLYLITYSYPLQWHSIDEEEAADFLIFFLPTIEGLLKHFTFEGKPFMHYLTNSLRNKLRSYKQHKYREKAYEIMAIHNFTDRTYHEDSYKCFCTDTHYSYRIEKSAAPGSAYHLVLPNEDSHQQDHLKVSINSNQLLCMLLFCFNEIQPDQIEAINTVYRLHGIDYETLTQKILAISKKRTAKLTHLQERRNTLFSEIIYLETQQMHEVEPERLATIKEKLRKKQSMLDTILQHIRGYHIHPSHKQIASILDIPKGSVDSGIFYFKKKLSALVDDS